MTIHCSKCGNELKKHGAIYLSPPDKLGQVLRGHLCRKCYRALIKDFIDAK